MTEPEAKTPRPPRPPRPRRTYRLRVDIEIDVYSSRDMAQIAIGQRLQEIARQIGNGGTSGAFSASSMSIAGGSFDLTVTEVER